MANKPSEKILAAFEKEFSGTESLSDDELSKIFQRAIAEGIVTEEECAQEGREIRAKIFSALGLDLNPR